MIRSNFVKALGLCALVAGLMAIVASSAQAEVGAKWTVNGTDAGTLPALVKGTIENADATLLTKILGIKTEILCTGTELKEVELIGEGKLKSGGKVKFTGCVGILNGEKNALCTPKAGGEPFGTVLTNAGKGELVLHTEASGTKIGVTKIEPATVGGPFATLEMEKGCPIGTKVPIIGVLFLLDKEVGVNKATHLIEELKALTKLWAISETEEHKATIDGSATVELTGAHTGLSWKGTPG